jgi:DNA-binding IclR family transcriptional regulator
MKISTRDIKKDDKKENRYSSSTPAVEQAAEVIKHLASQPKVKQRLSDISKALGINVTKTFVILDALQKSGFVNKDNKSKLYSLGPSLISIGQMAFANASYSDAVKPFLEEIVRETHCSASFGFITMGSLVVTAFESAGQPVDSRFAIGAERPIYFKAHGRIIAAYLPKEERELLIKSNFHGFYDEPYTNNHEKVRRDLAAYRKKGFAYASSDVLMNGTIYWIASAVLDVTNRPIGALIAVGLLPESSVAVCGRKVAEIGRRFSTLLGANWSAIEKNE